MSELKIWIAVRADLDMPAGKLAVQAAHGAATAIWRNPDVAADYMANSQAKIVVEVNSKDELIAIRDIAIAAGIPAALIVDEGRTVFNGPTPTVVAIGPTTRDALPPKIRRLRLYGGDGDLAEIL